jgi:BirA family biotin operon repressor/biotin-[acetyl-CoA-carboxylase] ligase
VGEGIERVSAVAPQLKWPNDVLLEGRKVAGILAEGVVGPRPFVVLGVGVNVSQPAEAWSADLRGRAVAVASVAPGVTRGPLLAAILERIAHWHAVLGTDGFEPVRTAWRVRARLGDRVRVGADEATAMDLSPEGGLLVRRPDGSTAVIFADVDERPGREPVAAGGMDRA